MKTKPNFKIPQKYLLKIDLPNTLYNTKNTLHQIFITNITPPSITTEHLQLTNSSYKCLTTSITLKYFTSNKNQTTTKIKPVCKKINVSMSANTSTEQIWIYLSLKIIQGIFDMISKTLTSKTTDLYCSLSLTDYLDRVNKHPKHSKKYQKEFDQNTVYKATPPAPLKINPKFINCKKNKRNKYYPTMKNLKTLAQSILNNQIQPQLDNLFVPFLSLFKPACYPHKTFNTIKYPKIYQITKIKPDQLKTKPTTITFKYPIISP